MHIVLNPKYDRLREQLVQAVRHFDSVGQEIYHARNVIRLIEIDGCRLAVKRYGRMPLKHRMATRVYKANKAKKGLRHFALAQGTQFRKPRTGGFPERSPRTARCHTLFRECLFGLIATPCATSPASTALSAKR